MTAKEMHEKHYTNSWIMIVTIMMFFISFFASYFVSGNELSSAFVKSCFVLFVANILSRILVIVWNLTIPKDQWMLIVHGPPAVERRSVRMQKERKNINLEAEIEEDDEMVMG